MGLEIEEEFDPIALGLLDEIDQDGSKVGQSNGSGDSGHAEVLLITEVEEQPAIGQREHSNRSQDNGALDDGLVRVSSSSEIGEEFPDRHGDLPESERSSASARPRQIRLVSVRLPGSRRYRMALRVISKRLPSSVEGISPSEALSPDIPSRSLPKGQAGRFVDAFGWETYDKVLELARADSTTGGHLPEQARSLFGVLGELGTTLHLVNAIRSQLELPHIVQTKSNRVDIIRAVAQARQALYADIFVHLTLPTISCSVDEAGEEQVEDPDAQISLTPDNITKLAKSLLKSFPQDKKGIKTFFKDGKKAHGEEKGRVVWQGGIGRVIGAGHEGFRGRTGQGGDVEVLMDHSNILYGLLQTLYSSTSTALPPRHLRVLSLPALSLLLCRGRHTPPGTLHSVASSPLRQDLDSLVRLGWEVSVLKRVEVVEDEVVDPEALHLKAKPMDRIPSGDKGGLKRWKEQAVDEVLHLKVLQAINAREHRPKAESMKAKSNGAKENGVNDSSEDKRFKLIPGVLDMGKIKRIQANGHEGSDKPSTKVSGSVGSMPTLVLATGDAKGGQFNSDGFLGAVREALLRGWRVELFSFKAGLSHTWYTTAKAEGWSRGGRFIIYQLDEWAEQLVEVGSDGW